MDAESKAQLDERNKINNDFLERNGSGDYSALDDYFAKYDNASDYSEGRTMDAESKAQLDERNEINNDFLERNGSGDYSALDDYFSKYDSNVGNSELQENAEYRDSDNVNSMEEQTENTKPEVEGNSEQKSTLKETIAGLANPDADTGQEEKIKETEAKLEEAEDKLDEINAKVENAETPEERKDSVNEQEKQQGVVNDIAELLKRHTAGR